MTTLTTLVTRFLADDAGSSDSRNPGQDEKSPREGDAWLAERFEEHRSRLRAVAYRMLGSFDEADDAVQEAWVRFSAAGADQVVNLRAWLTTIVTRVCLNTLRARAARRETLAGTRVPDPVLTLADGPTPEQEVLLADSVGLALLVVLDTLNPAERVAFVLHDVFDVPFGEIAPMLDRTPEAARQLASRARQRVRAAGASQPDGAPTMVASWPKLQWVGASGTSVPGTSSAKRSASSRLASTRMAAVSAVRVRLRSPRPDTAPNSSDRDR